MPADCGVVPTKLGVLAVSVMDNFLTRYQSSTTDGTGITVMGAPTSEMG